MRAPSRSRGSSCALGRECRAGARRPRTSGDRALLLVTAGTELQRARPPSGTDPSTQTVRARLDAITPADPVRPRFAQRPGRVGAQRALEGHAKPARFWCSPTAPSPRPDALSALEDLRRHERTAPRQCCKLATYVGSDTHNLAITAFAARRYPGQRAKKSKYSIAGAQTFPGSTRSRTVLRHRGRRGGASAEATCSCSRRLSEQATRGHRQPRRRTRSSWWRD